MTSYTVATNNIPNPMVETWKISCVCFSPFSYNRVIAFDKDPDPEAPDVISYTVTPKL